MPHYLAPRPAKPSHAMLRRAAPQHATSHHTTARPDTTRRATPHLLASTLADAHACTPSCTLVQTCAHSWLQKLESELDEARRGKMKAEVEAGKQEAAALAAEARLREQEKAAAEHVQRDLLMSQSRIQVPIFGDFWGMPTANAEG